VLQPFVIDGDHEPMKGRPIRNDLGLRISAQRDVADEGLAAERSILTIKPERFPGPIVEPVPRLRLGIVRPFTAPLAKPFLVGKLVNQIGDPLIERFGALPLQPVAEGAP
jgi:hypothetical protein